MYREIFYYTTVKTYKENFVVIHIYYHCNYAISIQPKFLNMVIKKQIINEKLTIIIFAEQFSEFKNFKPFCKM